MRLEVSVSDDLKELIQEAKKKQEEKTPAVKVFCAEEIIKNMFDDFCKTKCKDWTDDLNGNCLNCPRYKVFYKAIDEKEEKEEWM